MLIQIHTAVVGWVGPWLAFSPAPLPRPRVSPDVKVGGGVARTIEEGLFVVAELFMWPVTAAVVLALGYSLLSVGGVAAEAVQRWRHGGLTGALRRVEDRSVEGLELSVLKQLEGLRICSRLAPMLGLIATMIPLGPALVGVTGSGSSESVAALAPAFSTVILALVAASISFVLHTIRRRWLLEELHHELGAQGDAAGAQA